MYIVLTTLWANKYECRGRVRLARVSGRARASHPVPYHSCPRGRLISVICPHIYFFMKYHCILLVMLLLNIIYIFVNNCDAHSAALILSLIIFIYSLVFVRMIETFNTFVVYIHLNAFAKCSKCYISTIYVVLIAMSCYS